MCNQHGQEGPAREKNDYLLSMRGSHFEGDPVACRLPRYLEGGKKEDMAGSGKRGIRVDRSKSHCRMSVSIWILARGQRGHGPIERQ